MSPAEEAIGILERFAAERSLGAPDKILTRDFINGISGVGCQWGFGKEAVRTAVAFRGENLRSVASEVESYCRKWAELN